MKNLTLTLGIAALLLTAASSQAQFALSIYQIAPATPLYTSCSGTTPLEDGRLVKIFWDVDSDGPDATDPQPEVCSDPPDCTTPFGAANRNEFPVNGVEVGEGAGFFYTDPGFGVQTTLPTPPRYYLRVFELDGVTTLWTSDVITVVAGPQEYYMTDNDWTCGPSGPQCTVIDEAE